MSGLARGADAGFGLQIITALREKMTLEFIIYLLLPLGAFVLVMQIVFDAFFWEQNHILMGLAALVLIISPIYFLVNFLAIPEVDAALALDSKWAYMRPTFWITFGFAIVTTLYGLGYAFLDWREYVARRR